MWSDGACGLAGPPRISRGPVMSGMNQMIVMSDECGDCDESDEFDECYECDGCDKSDECDE